ncbi:MAG: hypothetical protein GXP49_06220 [Deltaproteobacteria bacterium]|nr:hypothetical protein [Deltaproteobacteria bacterium]
MAELEERFKQYLVMFLTILWLQPSMSGCFEQAPSRCLPVKGVLNAGFECSLDSKGGIQGWSISPGSPKTGTVALDKVTGRSGRVLELSNHDEGRLEVEQVVDDENLVGSILRLDASISVQGDSRAGISLYLEGKKNTPFLGASNKPVELSKEWSKTETYAVSYDPRGDHLRIVLWLDGPGSARFDDIAIVPGERDSLDQFKECNSSYDCKVPDEACRFGYCVPNDLPSGELGPPDLETRTKVFDFAWQYASDYAPGFVARPDLDWDQVHEHYGNQVKDAESLGAFGGALSRMIMEFGDGHASLMVGDACNSISTVVLTDNTDLACTTKTLDDRLVVYRSIPDNPLNLQPGDEILGYDGRDWKDIEADVFENWDTSVPCGTAFASKTSKEWAFPGSFLYNRFFFHETLEVRRKDGTIESLDLGPTMNMNKGRIICFDRPGFALPNEAVTGNTWRQGPVISTMLQDNQVVYAVVRWMDTSTENAVADLLKNHNDSKGMIFDVRYNRGGITAAFQPLWEALLRGDQQIQTSDLAQRDVLQKDKRKKMLIVGHESMIGKADKTYSGKIAVLVGPRAISAGDAIPWMLSHIKDKVRRFGLPTHGSFSGYMSNTQGIPIDAGRYSKYFQFMLPDFIMIDASDNSVLEGTDQEPDERVWLTPEGLAESKDDVLEKAIEWIME